MGLFDWAEQVIKKLTVWDYAMLKTALIILGLIVGAYISDFVKQYVWYFTIVFVVLYIWLLRKVFKK